jgi:hypothetical protein
MLVVRLMGTAAIWRTHDRVEMPLAPAWMARQLLQPWGCDQFCILDTAPGSTAQVSMRATVLIAAGTYASQQT